MDAALATHPAWRPSPTNEPPALISGPPIRFGGAPHNGMGPSGEMHSPQVRRSEIVADDNGARLVVGVPPFGPSSSHGAVGPTFEEQQWLDEEEAMEEARALKAAEEEYVARCLTLHPNLEEAEARWLWQREKALREGRMDEG